MSLSKIQGTGYSLATPRPELTQAGSGLMHAARRKEGGAGE